MTEIAAGDFATGDCWIAANELGRATGARLSAQGVCLGETCTPLPSDCFAKNDGQTWLNFSRFAESGGYALLRAGDLWAYGGEALPQSVTATAPDFTLADLDGREHSL